MIYRITLFLLMTCMVSGAAWVNFPAADPANTGYQWDDIKTNWIQLVLATKERSIVSGAFSGFDIVSTFPVDVGVSNSVGGYISKGFPDVSCNWVLTRMADYLGHPQYGNAMDARLRDNGSGTYTMIGTNGGNYVNSTGLATTNWYDAYNPTAKIYGASTVYTNSYTNTFMVYSNVVSTNYAPVTYTDTTGATHTVRPSVIQADVAAMDDRIMTLVPYFVNTNVLVSSKFDDYFSKTNALPMLTASNLFRTNHIGFVDTNGVAYFTRYPKQTNYWLLAECTYTGAWITTHSEVAATNYFTNTPPAAFYISTTNLTAGTFALSGTVIRADGIFTNDTESVSISASNTPLIKVWYSVASIKNTGGGNTGDVLAIAYTNTHAIYGAAPFEMFASDLDERYQVLSALVMTCKNPSWRDDGANTNGSRLDFGFPWETAIANASAANLSYQYNEYSRSQAGAFTFGNVFSDGTYTNPTDYIAEIVALTNNVKLSPILAGASNFTAMAYIYNSMSTNVLPAPFTTNLTPLFYGVTGQVTFAFDPQGDAATYKTNYTQWASSYELKAGETQSVWFGKTDPYYSPVWCAQPLLTPYWQTTIKGYVLKTPYIFYDWTKGTNPLVYK